MFDLDPNSAVPLYHQLKEILRRKITEQSWTRGQMIPTEFELADQFGVSRTTVREAVTALVNEGLLERKQGKGTFVTAAYFEEKLGRLTGFAEEVLETGSSPSAKLISAEFKTGPVYEKVPLEVPDDVSVLRIERIRTAAGVPIAYERSAWPEDIGKLLMKENLNEAAFYKVLEKQDIHLRDADETIRAVNASTLEADLLGVNPGAALLEMCRLSRGMDGRPIEYTRTSYRADRYSYKVSLQRHR